MSSKTATLLSLRFKEFKSPHHEGCGLCCGQLCPAKKCPAKGLSTPRHGLRSFEDPTVVVARGEVAVGGVPPVLYL